MQACRDVLARPAPMGGDIGSWEKGFARSVAAIEALGPPG